jgi:hypothetical protein
VSPTIGLQWKVKAEDDAALLLSAFLDISRRSKRRLCDNKKDVLK